MGFSVNDDIEHIRFVCIDESIDTEGSKEICLYRIGMDFIVYFCKNPLCTPSARKSLGFLCFKSLKFSQDEVLKFWGYPRSKFQGDINMSIGSTK